MKAPVFATFGFCLFASMANAVCVGSDVYQTCSDNSGNSYSVTRAGNHTSVNGYNSHTGSS
jgi:hypothetical protein